MRPIKEAYASGKETCKDDTQKHENRYTHTPNLIRIGYGVATISRLLKSPDLFCRISSLLWGSFAKETYNFIDPTHRSHS